MVLASAFQRIGTHRAVICELAIAELAMVAPVVLKLDAIGRGSSLG